MPNNKKNNIVFFEQDNNSDLLSNVSKKFKFDTWVNGKIINKLETNIKKYLKTDYFTSTCNSGTDALKLSLILDRNPKKDIYITTPFSYIATASVVKSLGLNLIYIDINNKNFLLDLDKLEIFLESAQPKIKKRIKGIIIVELFGNTVDLKRLSNIAKKNKLTLIGDCAQSFGTKYCGISTVNYYDYSAISFYPTKILSCYGDGGLLIIKNEKKFNKSLLLKNNGHSLKDKNTCKVIGMNSRMDSLQAYIIDEKMNKFSEVLKRKKVIINYYNKYLSNICKIPIFNKNNNPNNYIYSFYIDQKIRNNFLNFMKKNKVQTKVFYKKLLPESMTLKPLIKTSLTNAHKCKNELICIPCHEKLTKSQLEKIIFLVKKFYSNFKKN